MHGQGDVTKTPLALNLRTLYIFLTSSTTFHFSYFINSSEKERGKL
jgi:hypothetical protein